MFKLDLSGFIGIYLRLSALKNVFLCRQTKQMVESK